MATSKKDPPNPSRDRATRMSPNLRPSSSESSSGYGARRARSVPSSPDRKFGPSSSSTAASGSPDVYRPSLSFAGRSISSRSMSSSGSSIHGSRAQPFPGAASKPMLAKVKSDKATTASQRPPALAVTPSNSFKDMATTVAASKAPSSTLQKSKLSPKPSANKATAASPKRSTQKVVAPGAVRGGRTQPVSSGRAPGAAAKKRAEAANGGATAVSWARSAPQRAMDASATMKEKEEEPSMQFEESESISTPSIEEHLHEQLPDPVNLNSMAMAALASAQPGQEEPYSDHQEQQGKNEEEVKGHFSEEKEDAGGIEVHNGGQDADASAKNKLGIVNAADESEQVEKEEAKAKADKVVPVWRKDDPKSNDVIEETKSKLLEERKSRVKALVGAFETVMSFKE